MFLPAALLFLLTVLNPAEHQEAYGDCNVPHYLFLPQKDTHWDFKSNYLLQPLFSCGCVDLVHLMSIKVLQDNFTISINSINEFELEVNTKSESSIKGLQGLKQTCIIVLLLLISGNVQPSPGPDVAESFNTSADFKSRSWLYPFKCAQFTCQNRSESCMGSLN